jgi:hypothetical protein
MKLLTTPFIRESLRLVENPGEREPRDMAYPKEYGESGKH